jgi:ribose 1,5-bisphosphokinase PhnN
MSLERCKARFVPLYLQLTHVCLAERLRRSEEERLEVEERLAQQRQEKNELLDEIQHLKNNNNLHVSFFHIKNVLIIIFLSNLY